MTRKECEEKIIAKIEEIAEIYHKYDPTGGNLSMSYRNGFIDVNNDYWNGWKKLDCFKTEDGEIHRIER